MPHGFSAFNQGPPGPGMGGLGFAPPGPAAAGGLGSLFGAPPGAGIGPAGGFGSMEREPPNYSFGTSPTFGTTGPPGGAMMGGGGGSFGAGSGFANPAPGFGAPGSPPGGAGFGRSPPGMGFGAPGMPPPGMGTKASDGPGGGQTNANANANAAPPGSPGRRDGRDRPKMPVPNAPPFTAFVGNFPYECSQDEVVGLFAKEQCQIADVRVVRNRDTDRPRGYFLEFKDRASLETALTFDQRDLGGRPLRVNVAEGRPERRDRGYGNGHVRDEGVAQRYSERAGRDGFARSGGGFAERYNDARGGGGNGGGHGGGGASFGRREGGGGYQEAREYRDRGNKSGNGGRRSFDGPSDAPPPEGRKKLVLAARTVPKDGDADANQPASATQASSGKPNPFGAARPVDSSAKMAEAERKIKEEKDAVHAKAGIARGGSGELPAPKPIAKPAAQDKTEKREKKAPVIVLAPKEEPVIKAKNAFELLARDDDDDDEDEEGSEGEVEE